MTPGAGMVLHLLLCAQDDTGSYFSWESFHRLESDTGNVFCRSGAQQKSEDDPSQLTILGKTYSEHLLSFWLFSQCHNFL